MNNKIIGDIFVEYHGDGEKDGKFVVPQNIKRIVNYAFERSDSLEEVVLPENLDELCYCAFMECSSLKVIKMSSNIKEIEPGAMWGIENLEKIIIDGNEIQINDKILDRFDEVYPFLCYCVKHNKFIPKNIFILTNTKVDEIEKYYKKSKEWKDILSKYLSNWKENLAQKEKVEIDLAVGNLYQATVALGLFQDGEDGIRAKQFIENIILNLSPQELHNRFGMFATKQHGYNKEFADFYIKNYCEINNEGCGFLHKKDNDSLEDIDYTGTVYNNWAVIKSVYPNKTVLAHRERGSENNNLTEKDVIYAVTLVNYQNVHDGNEEMAEIVGRYGYTQQEFDMLQEWFDKSKEILNETILTISPDTNHTGVTYELLEKDNPEALILGEKTNCCQTVNDAGAPCVEYGATKPNSGFIKFTYDGKIVGQSWVWYNEETGVVCLDNIEIPTIWINELHKKEFQESFVDCVKRVANAFVCDMKQKGHKVKMVTIGSGYNDLVGINSFKKETTSNDVLPSDYKRYSDATNSWYIVPGIEKTLIENNEIIK